VTRHFLASCTLLVSPGTRRETYNLFSLDGLLPPLRSYHLSPLGNLLPAGFFTHLHAAHTHACARAGTLCGIAAPFILLSTCNRALSGASGLSLPTHRAPPLDIAGGVCYGHRGQLDALPRRSTTCMVGMGRRCMLEGAWLNLENKTAVGRHLRVKGSQGSLPLFRACPHLPLPYLPCALILGEHDTPTPQQHGQAGGRRGEARRGGKEARMFARTSITMDHGYRHEHNLAGA